jgi:hypothetical protein
METSEKITSKHLFAAIQAKFPKAAVLPEVTMEDELEAHRQRTLQVKLHPRSRFAYNKRGLTYDAELPEGYELVTSVPIRRIDALILDWKTRWAVEIKVSRADFFRDTEAKRSAWMRHTDKFVYLVPKGLIKLEEVPDGCGLWEYENGKITSVKNAKTNKEAQEFPQSMVKYFAWRAFAAEQKVATLHLGPRPRRKRRRK